MKQEINSDAETREGLSNRHGRLNREEINFLLVVPPEIDYVSPEAVGEHDVETAIKRSQSPDWTIRLREIHKLARYRDDKAYRRLIILAKFEKSKHCRNVAVLYANLRGAKLKYPPAYRHLREIPEMRHFDEWLKKCKWKLGNRETAPSIEKIMHHFLKMRPDLYYLVEGSVYQPTKPDALRDWFKHRCDKVKVPYVA